MTFAQKAEAAWFARHGEAAPAWVMRLAERADAEGLKGAGRAIGYSPSAVSSVLAAKYAGDLGRVADVCRGAFMGDVVMCPVLGEIGLDRCLQEQKEPFRATSPYRTQLYHACRGGCPHSRIGGGGDGQ